MFRLFLLVNFVFAGILGATSAQKCKLDRACVTKQTKEIYKRLFEDKSNQLDPMYQKLIDGNLGPVNYSVTNTTIIGFKTCSVRDANLDMTNMVLDMDLYCPEFHLKGMYEINGYLIVMPVEGKGEFTLDSKAYDIKAKMDVSLIPKDNQHYLRINNFKLELFALEGVVYDLKNLFNGQKELADNFLKFINENWKDVAEILQEPIFVANFKKVVKAANKFFKEQIFEDFIEI